VKSELQLVVELRLAAEPKVAAVFRAVHQRRVGRESQIAAAMVAPRVPLLGPVDAQMPRHLPSSGRRDELKNSLMIRISAALRGRARVHFGTVKFGEDKVCS
jgi:hypothetical protein